MPTVRTTIRPDLPIEVDDIEYRQLEREGLLVVGPPAPEAAPAPAVPDRPSPPDKKTPTAKTS